MITRTSDLLVIEGLAVPPENGEAARRVPRRIEINEKTGLIERVGEPRGAGDLVLDGSYWIFPGLVDLHVHAREDVTSSEAYKESFQTAGDAAIHGGVVAFADMPNNPSPPVDDASYAAKRALAKSCPVDVLLYAGIGPGTRPLSFPAPYKAYMGPSIGKLFFKSVAALRETLARYRGLTVAFHAEDPEILQRSRGAPTHAERRPPEAEVRAIETALSICEEFRIEPHICHLSTEAGLEVVRRARRRGLHVTCEVSPHHLYYDQDNLSTYAQPSFLQVNPPIRSRLDRIALLDALRGGEIDFVASDHAPHTLDEKEKGISGVPHLDTFGTFAFWLMDEGVPAARVCAACAERPGKWLSRYLPGRYGQIEVGSVGSLTILREQKQTVRRTRLRTRAGWSPLEGYTARGRVSHTIVRGRIHPQIDE